MCSSTKLGKSQNWTQKCEYIQEGTQLPLTKYQFGAGNLHTTSHTYVNVARLKPQIKEHNVNQLKWRSLGDIAL